MNEVWRYRGVLDYDLVMTPNPTNNDKNLGTFIFFIYRSNLISSLNVFPSSFYTARADREITG